MTACSDLTLPLQEMSQFCTRCTVRFNITVKRISTELRTDYGTCLCHGCAMAKGIRSSLMSVMRVGVHVMNIVNKLCLHCRLVNESFTSLVRFAVYSI